MEYIAFLSAFTSSILVISLPFSYLLFMYSFLLKHLKIFTRDKCCSFVETFCILYWLCLTSAECFSTWELSQHLDLMKSPSEYKNIRFCMWHIRKKAKPCQIFVLLSPAMALPEFWNFPSIETAQGDLGKQTAFHLRFSPTALKLGFNREGGYYISEIIWSALGHTSELKWQFPLGLNGA